MLFCRPRLEPEVLEPEVLEPEVLEPEVLEPVSPDLNKAFSSNQLLLSEDFL